MSRAAADPALASRLGLTRPMALILFTVFLDLLGIGLIFPIGPFYASAFGASAFDVGLLFTLFSVAQFLTIPILGALSDRYGRRPVLLIGIAGEVVGYILFGTAISLTMLYVSRLVAGASSGNIGAAQAYIADISTPRERTRSFGLLGAAVSVGFLFGPAMGGLPGSVRPSPPSVRGRGADHRQLGVGPGLAPRVPASGSSLDPCPQHWPQPVRHAVYPFRPPAPLTATFLCNVAFSGYLTSFALFTNARFGWGPQQVALVLVIQSIMSILIQAFGLRRLSESLPDTTILLLGIGTNLLGFLVIALAPDPAWIYLLAAPLQAGGSALWRPSLSSLIAKLVSGREQGLANGGSQASAAVATIIGPMGTGVLFERVGAASPFFAGAGLFALAAATIALTVRLQPGLGRSPLQTVRDG